ncbi:MAG: YegP family protein [Woeseiaceae bacterium]
MAGKFECYKDKAGEFRFRLKAGNGENILSSEGYKSKASCTNGIASVQKNCLDEKCFEKKTTDSGKFRFNLKSTNGQVIGTSQSYDSASGRDNGIGSVTRSAPGASIDDQT